MDEAAGKSAGRSKSEEKGRQILEAAGCLFMREGFEVVSMEQVAKEAGVSKQTVYSHFGNKEALFSAAIASRCIAHQLSDEDLDSDRPVAEFLRELAQRFSDLITSDAGIAINRVCISEAAKDRSRVSELFWEAGPERLFAVLSDYLRRQVAAGRLRIDNIDFAASQFLHMIKADAHMRGVLGLPNEEELAELPAYLDSCVEVFMRAYG